MSSILAFYCFTEVGTLCKLYNLLSISNRRINFGAFVYKFSNCHEQGSGRMTGFVSVSS